jgi:dTDP-4-dehydrorhamnose 3,5-epimerase
MNQTLKSNHLDKAEILGVKVWSNEVHSDIRGSLIKFYSSEDSVNFPIPFVTFEHFITKSSINTFRGFHLQDMPHPVSKVISIISGRALDILFDARSDSETFGKIQVILLDPSSPKSIFIPIGVAHGYLALENDTIISYRMSGAFCKNCDSGFQVTGIEDILGRPLNETIRSKRDVELPDFKTYQYSSSCSEIITP